MEQYCVMKFVMLSNHNFVNMKQGNRSSVKILIYHTYKVRNFDVNRNIMLMNSHTPLYHFKDTQSTRLIAHSVATAANHGLAEIRRTYPIC